MNFDEKLEPVTMKNITINIPVQYDDIIQKLIKLKLVPNRSEAIRTALREYLSEEFQNLKLFDEFQNLKLFDGIKEPQFPNKIQIN